MNKDGNHISYKVMVGFLVSILIVVSGWLVYANTREVTTLQNNFETLNGEQKQTAVKIGGLEATIDSHEKQLAAVSEGLKTINDKLDAVIFGLKLNIKR
jgi:septal ring factor EnvC (AmiA/AmiB activator)